MADISLTLLSSLEKVMRNEPAENIDYNRFSMLNNEKKSFQLYIKADSETISLDIKSDLNCIKVFTVEYMPSGFAINKKTADDYVL